MEIDLLVARIDRRDDGAFGARRAGLTGAGGPASKLCATLFENLTAAPAGVPRRRRSPFDLHMPSELHDIGRCHRSPSSSLLHPACLITMHSSWAFRGIRLASYSATRLRGVLRKGTHTPRDILFGSVGRRSSLLHPICISHWRASFGARTATTALGFVASTAHERARSRQRGGVAVQVRLALRTRALDRRSWAAVCHRPA